MDMIGIIIVFAALVAGFWSIGLWRWFWIGLAIYLGAFEAYSVITTGKTISQAFQAYSLVHPMGAWALVGLLTAVFILWMIHLMWKRIRRKK